MIPKLEDLSYLECMTCKNYFFIHEIGMGINDPNFCPYCGIEFTETKNGGTLNNESD
jgi:DNA-directed RNA polymerase subunit RPC12/RpoP